MLLGGKFLFSWVVYPLPMTDLSGLSFGGDEAEAPAFYEGTFTVEEPADTFLRTDSFKKGFVVLNGFNLGRYWEVGPQKTLYVPGPLLKKGENTLLLFESDGRKGEAEVEFVDRPEL